jgi:hypothetical protein
MEALSSLDVSINGIGKCDILPDGWIYDPRPNTYDYQNASLKKYQIEPPRGSKSSGVIALAGAIKDMELMTSLNLASNYLGSRGAKIVAEAIKVTKCTPAISMAPFSFSSVFSNNYCCLLLSAGYGGVDVAEYVCQWTEGGRGW